MCITVAQERRTIAFRTIIILRDYIVFPTVAAQSEISYLLVFTKTRCFLVTEKVFVCCRYWSFSNCHITMVVQITRHVAINLDLVIQLFNS